MVSAGTTTQEQAASNNPISPSSTPLRVGCTAVDPPTQFFSGKIAETLIYGAFLSQTEVQWNYNHPRMPVTRGLILWLPLDEGTNNAWSLKAGVKYALRIEAYSLDGTVITLTQTTTCTT